MTTDVNPVINEFGDKYWYTNEQLHRDDGPAIEFKSGTKYWCKNGKLHRENGPAIELSGGTRYWHQNGRLHREYGPAVERADGSEEYWLYGVQMGIKDYMWKMVLLQFCRPDFLK